MDPPRHPPTGNFMSCAALGNYIICIWILAGGGGGGGGSLSVNPIPPRYGTADGSPGACHQVLIKIGPADPLTESLLVYF